MSTQPMTAHVPEVRAWDDGFGIGCTCGWLDPYLWSGEEGIREAFANHILKAFVPEDWGTYQAEAVES